MKKIKGKLIAVLILLFFDIGFIYNFSNYNLENRLFTFFCIGITLFLIFQIIRTFNKDLVDINDSTKNNESVQKQNAIINKKTFEERMRERIDNNQINPIVPRSMVSKKDELVYLEQAATLKTVQNKLLGTTGSSGGASVRVAKGLYLRTGSSGSKKIYGDVISEYPGTLAISNQRIVFSNPKKGFEIPFNKLSSIESDFETIVFQQGNKTFYIESTHGDMIEYFIRHIISQSN